MEHFQERFESQGDLFSIQVLNSIPYGNFGVFWQGEEIGMSRIELIRRERCVSFIRDIQTIEPSLRW